MHRIEVTKGQRVLSVGEEGQCAYIVEQGSVRIEDAVSVLKEYTVGPGEMFGEYGVIPDSPHYCVATAEEDSLLLVVPREEIEEKAKLSDPMVSLFLNFFMDRCHSLTERHYHEGRTEKIPSPNRRSVRDKVNKNRDELVEIFKTKEELERAVEQNEFVLHFQPIISLRGGFTAGFEALVRWDHPDRGLLSPFHFIDIAEQTNAIVPLGEWVFEEACRHVAPFNKIAAEGGSPEIFVSINISAKQFAVPDIVDRFKEMIANTNVNTSHVQLEITESVLMEDTTHAKGILHQIKDLGFQLVLDDFGTGYSSLNYLHQFPIDKLKIDRSFTHTMLNDEDSCEIVRAIAGLAHNLNIEVVAEGIEEREQLSLYRDLDCHYGQGFLISKPLPVEKVYEILGTRMAI
ncbi:EAL domain-containing protein [Sneathiella sp.]|uniref:EAL domain-containing protein n=1 Tax=Sneathiella sp. TaxID=1964365 RepID=UPI0039E654FD